MISNSSHSRTTAAVSTFMHTWSIENFNHWHLCGKNNIKSTYFSPPDNAHFKFNFTIHYAGKSKKTGRDRYRIFFDYQSKKWLKSTRFAVKAFMIDGSGRKHYAQEFTVKVTKLFNFKNLGKFLMFGNPFSFVPNYTVTLGCEITYVSDVVTVEKILPNNGTKIRDFVKNKHSSVERNTDKLLNFLQKF